MAQRRDGKTSYSQYLVLWYPTTVCCNSVSGFGCAVHGDRFFNWMSRHCQSWSNIQHYVFASLAQKLKSSNHILKYSCLQRWWRKVVYNMHGVWLLSFSTHNWLIHMLSEECLYAGTKFNFLIPIFTTIAIIAHRNFKKEKNVTCGIASILSVLETMTVAERGWVTLPYQLTHWYQHCFFHLYYTCVCSSISHMHRV